MIFFETQGQASLFLLLCYAGAGAAIAYDVIAPLRRRAPSFIAGIMDIIWCLMAGGLCALALALGGEGKMRGYALLGLFCGAGVYGLGVRRVIQGLYRGIQKRLKNEK